MANLLVVPQSIDRSSIMNTERVYDSMNVYLEFKNADDAALLKDVYQRFGQTVKTLEWSNWSSFEFNENEIVEFFNFLPNLEELRLSSWRTAFKSSESSAKILQKLKKLVISDCESFFGEFLNKHLPESILKELIVSEGATITPEVLNNFLSKQNSIKNLEISGNNFSDAGAFKNLKLKQLRCILYENESTASQQAFLNALIQSQPGLTSLDTLSEQDYSFNFVNDEIFQEIVKCSSLESLKINIDGITASGIKSIEQLKQLKSFNVKTNRESSIEAFNELSLLKLPVESLVLRLWSFEIPQPIYRQFGENFNLKSLKITLGTRHPVSFFIESFPKLESLSIRFGESNNTVELSNVFTGEDLKVHSNMKSLDLQFWGRELTTSESFLKLLSCFPSLEKLKIHSKFPFAAEFFNAITSNLKSVKSLEIDGISVEDDVVFSPEVIESLKTVSKQLSYCNMSIRYVKELFGAHGHVMIVEEPAAPVEVAPESNFSFEPLKVALKDHFKINESNIANIRVMKTLTLTIGEQIE